MIQPPARVGARRGVRGAALVTAVVVAVPVLAYLGRSGSPAVPVPTPAATAAAAPSNDPLAEDLPSGSKRVVIPIAAGPMAVAVGFAHVWVASAGDGAV